MIKKATAKTSEPRPESDKAKKVFRAALDTIRRLDDIMKNKRAHRNVFLPDAINLRSRLQTYCERLMFYDPLEYGRKAEELLWRKVYYDVIQLMKHNRKQMRLSSTLEGAFRTHLMASTGYYYHLLFKLQHEYGLSLEGVIDFFHIPEPKSHRKPHQSSRRLEADHATKEWALRACHRCLVYLGDTARYQQDYEGTKSRIASQRYYSQALSICPDIGMPYNQLGTLAGTRCYNLDAAYYYLRCLACENSFEGAHDNLLRLFVKNQRRYIEVSQVSPRDLPPEQQRSKDIKRFVVRFLHLLDVLCTDGKVIESKDLQECCQATLQDFNLCMFYQPPHVTDPHQVHVHFPEEKSQHLEDEMVFKIVVICIIVMYKLQSSSDHRVTAAIAFSLALFSHILNHVVIRLQAALYELENPRKVLQVDSADEKNRTNTVGVKRKNSRRSSTSRPTSAKKDSNTAEEPEKTDKHRQKVHKLRRRRRRRHSSGSSTGSDPHQAMSDDSDLSEGEMGDIPSDSESEEEIPEYLSAPHYGSSDSENDDDLLMVSQELRPGFSSQTASPFVESSGDGPGTSDLQQAEKNIKDAAGMSLNGFHNGGLGSSLSESTRSEPMPDMSQLLEDFSMEWLSDSANLFQQTLKITGPGALPTSNGQVPLDGLEGGVSDTEIKKVMQGKKNVSVPPGFEKSDESEHVREITERLANFVIETDTDSNFPTDTDNSTVATESEQDTEIETDKESIIDKVEQEEQRLRRLVQVITNEGLLASIKVYCDWMRCNPNIIATCAKSSQSLWSRLSVLLNFLPLEQDIGTLEICKTDAVLSIIKKAALREWLPIEPLCEDIHLQKLPALHDTQASLVYDCSKRLGLSQQQQALLRNCLLRRFGYYIARHKTVNLSFNQEKGMFYGPIQQQEQQQQQQQQQENSDEVETIPSPEQDKQAAQQKMADAQVRRNQLMRDMAQLRLQAEVSQLEGSLQASDTPSLPPYLVPDSSALCGHLQLLRQLANSARFIVIIPLAVIDQLDLLKKESSGAREAIRWLEAEFKKGNRYVRAQKNHEKTATQPLKNLKKKDRDAWRFTQIIDCCLYLAQQSVDCNPHELTCVLTSEPANSPQYSIRVKQAISNAKQQGVSVQTVPEFHVKWREIWKSSKT